MSPFDMTPAQLRALADEIEAREARECTGLSATWCPIHGDCECPEPAEGLDDPWCPLHGSRSLHAVTFSLTACPATLRYNPSFLPGTGVTLHCRLEVPHVTHLDVIGGRRIWFGSKGWQRTPPADPVADRAGGSVGSTDGPTT